MYSTCVPFSDMTSTNNFHLIVIGAGIYGLQAARTYLEFHPTDKVLILEADSCIGGVWSANRVYEAFWTQSPLGIWEFSDRRLKSVEVEETFYRYFQAQNFTQYLHDYADQKVFDGKSLKQRVLYGAKVERLWKENLEWYTRTTAGLFTAPKIIDASGQTSIPNIPEIPGALDFRGIIIHHRDFALSDLPQRGRRIVVIGGGKSAADVVYACTKSGSNVSWVIRKNGNGPAAYFPPDSPIGYYNDSNSSFHNRFMATLITSVYRKETWWTWFLERTVIGRCLFKFIWAGLQKELLSRSNYDREDGQANGFANLKPDTELFWQNDGSSINQRPDFFDLVAQKVKVYRQNVDRIGPNGVHLADGTDIAVDGIVYCTGWKAETPYIEAQMACFLGIAAPLSAVNSNDSAKWQMLEDKADREVIRRFPVLRDVPPCYKYEQTMAPFRLYNAMLPIRDHSIVFLGKMSLANGTYNAEVQALFAVAVFDKNIQLPSEEKMEEEVALVRAWQRRRYPGKGGMGNWFYFDILPYTDTILGQLGVSGHRVGEFGGVFTPMKARALCGIIDEFKAKVNGMGGEVDDDDDDD